MDPKKEFDKHNWFLRKILNDIYYVLDIGGEKKTHNMEEISFLHKTEVWQYFRSNKILNSLHFRKCFTIINYFYTYFEISVNVY